MIKPKNLTVIMAALVFFLILKVPAAKATVTYTFTGTGDLTGTEFSYVSSGYLSFPFGLAAPTTKTGLFFLGTDDGLIQSFAFEGPQTLAINYDDDPIVPGDPNGGTVLLESPSSSPYSLGNLSDQTIGSGDFTGTLQIEDTAVTPEPGTAVLWLIGTALLGLALMRKRVASVLHVPPDRSAHYPRP
jgi:hypothetical protein